MTDRNILVSVVVVTSPVAKHYGKTGKTPLVQPVFTSSLFAMSNNELLLQMRFHLPNCAFLPEAKLPEASVKTFFFKDFDDFLAKF